jgi:hypothetical protein
MPTILATDDFNRANADDLGANWTVDHVYIGIRNNRCSSYTGSVGWARYTAGSQPPNNQKCGAKVYRVAGGNGASERMGPVVRMDAAGNGYFARVFYLLGVYQNIMLCKGKDEVQIGSTYSGAFVQGDRIEVEAVGNQISVYREGTRIIGPVTDNSFASGRCGVVSIQQSTLEGTPQLDDWEQWDATPYNFSTDFVIPFETKLMFAADLVIPLESRCTLKIDYQIPIEGLLLNHIYCDFYIPIAAKATLGVDLEIPFQNRFIIIPVSFDFTFPFENKLRNGFDFLIPFENSVFEAWQKAVIEGDAWVKVLPEADAWVKVAKEADGWVKS